jgi:hypothetical protein
MYYKYYRDSAFACAKLRAICESEKDFYDAMQLVAERRKQVRESASDETESESITAIYDLLATGIKLEIAQELANKRYAQDICRYYKSLARGNW